MKALHTAVFILSAINLGSAAQEPGAPPAIYKPAADIISGLENAAASSASVKSGGFETDLTETSTENPLNSRMCAACERAGPAVMATAVAAKTSLFIKSSEVKR